MIVQCTRQSDQLTAVMRAVEALMDMAIDLMGRTNESDGGGADHITFGGEEVGRLIRMTASLVEHGRTLRADMTQQYEWGRTQLQGVSGSYLDVPTLRLVDECERGLVLLKESENTFRFIEANCSHALNTLSLLSDDRNVADAVVVYDDLVDRLRAKTMPSGRKGAAK